MSNHIIYFLLLFLIGSSNSSSQPKDTKATISVMSYNIHHGNPPSRKEGIIDLNAVAKIINKENPDLVALQEVDVHTTRSGESLNEAQKLGELTRMHYYFTKAINYKGGQYGDAVLSRFPIQDTMRYELPIHRGTNAETRSVCMIEVALNKKNKLYFASTHLGLRKENRLLQAKKISTIIQSISAPVIIAGDFNSTAGSPTINRLDSSLTRSCQEKCGPTFSSSNPHEKIDFIMYHPADKFRVKKEKVIHDAVYASDHLPVFAQLRIY